MKVGFIAWAAWARRSREESSAPTRSGRLQPVGGKISGLEKAGAKLAASIAAAVPGARGRGHHARGRRRTRAGGPCAGRTGAVSPWARCTW